jgi:hypothetical protein
VSLRGDNESRHRGALACVFAIERGQPVTWAVPNRRFERLARLTLSDLCRVYGCDPRGVRFRIGGGK